ncbi:VWA domain-containing protein [Gimesia sp.]|uniref:VWA domain-containing protein n=1 Tax=Gimesia sp. TaxID=2024833 RepID=UPI003A8C9A68
MKHFYLKKNDNIEGPYDHGELVYLLSQGELHPDEKVREGEQGTWMPATQLLGNNRQRKKTSPSSSPKTQREITGLKRRPASELQSVPEGDATSCTSTSSDPQYLETIVPGRSPSTVHQPLEENQRKKLLLAAAIALLLLIILCLLYWLFFSSQAGSGHAGGGQGGHAAQGDQNSSSDSKTSGAEQGKSQDEVPPQSASATEKSSSTQQQSSQPVPPQPDVKPQSSRSSSGMSSQPPDPKQGTMNSSEPPPAYSVGTARFFGIEAEGPVFVYVVDSSSSMRGPRIDLTKKELKKSINQLNLSQSFYVIFFSNTDYPMFYPGEASPRPLPATDQNVMKLEQWVDGIRSGGGTDPKSALLRALSLAPDSIFLMTDGAFDSQVADLLKTQNAGKVAIHTIVFQSRSGENLLKRIAQENSGQHRFVP